jgi:phosphopantothenoylcysteine decarboxylase/phosphopantothenate--cysteine ligase
MRHLKDKQIVLGVTGGIAAYKVVQLARNLALAGALVDVVMTAEATKFVTPLTFQALTHRPVYTDLWEMANATDISHVALGERADLIVIAPATAHTLARLAAGFSDDMLTTTVLATRAPILLAPAMNVTMWANQATQANLAILQQRGMLVIPPGEGRMAEPMTGVGRLAEIELIEAEIAATLGRASGPMRGWQVVVTAGGTHEALDPVRFIGNRSSGAMGYALAAAARDAGATVTLISGPASAAVPGAVTLVQVESAREMHAAVHSAVAQADLLIMAAAVADYTPATVAEQKIKKTGAGGDQMVLHLGQTVDILASLRELTGFIKVGFAAETTDIEAYARAKLQRKNLDLIVANDARTALGAADNAVTVYAADGAAWPLERQPKPAIAEQILDLIISRWPRPKAQLKQQ